jgi:hypothetical protein
VPVVLSRRLAPLRLTPARSAPERLAALRLAPVRGPGPQHPGESKNVRVQDKGIDTPVADGLAKGGYSPTRQLLGRTEQRSQKHRARARTGVRYWLTRVRGGPKDGPANVDRGPGSGGHRPSQSCQEHLVDTGMPFTCLGPARQPPTPDRGHFPRTPPLAILRSCAQSLGRRVERRGRQNGRTGRRTALRCRARRGFGVLPN